MLSNRFFPYSSMQEINLDWILTKIKNILRFVPDDGAVGQILRRTAHGAEWSNEQGGGGGAVSSVNGQTGAVVLTASDVGALPDTYAAPVDSVNGQTGAVVLTIPTDTGDLTNGAGYVDTAGAAAAAPVQSVNGQTGAVVLDASDVGALADTTVIPDSTSDLINDSGFVNAAGAAAAAPVQSVNGQTGAVVLSVGDKIRTAFLSKSITLPSQSQGGYALFGSKANFGIPAAATIISAVIVGFSGFGAGYGGICVALSSDGNNVYLFSVNSGTGTFGVRVSYIE
jgi:hypothetical protein